LEKYRSKLVSTSIKLVILALLLGCGQPPQQFESDLALPDFSFIGLADPMPDKENIKLTVHIKIPYSELKFTRSADKYAANYEIGITIADADDERINGEIWKDSIIVDTYDDTRRDNQYIHAQSSFVLPASPLSLSVRVTDLFTRKTRVLTDAVDHSGMYDQSLALGNIAIINGAQGSESRSILTEQTFFEIIDILRFQIRLSGLQGPYQLQYSLFHKDEVVETVEDLIDTVAAIDTLLYYEMPLTDMTYSSYTLVFTATDGKEATVKTRSKFRVHIQGIGYEVGDLEQAIKQLRYIADDREINFMLEGSEEDRYNKFKAFWLERDPSPGTGPNELMEEYYRRVGFSIEAFTNVQEGWRTDRGMVYILFGPPDEIEAGPFELSTKPYEIWHYYHLNREFIFVDQTGFGDYRLENPYSDQRDWRFRY